MAFELTADPKLQDLTGVTLTSASPCRGLFTGIYVPAAHNKTMAASDGEDGAPPVEMLNVAIWLHGFEVTGVKDLFTGNQSKIRDSVSKSGRDVILIAPFLGRVHATGTDANGNTIWDGHLDSKTLAGTNGGELYIDEALLALAKFWNPGVANPPIPRVKNLVLACHSGGGVPMRAAVQGLGKYLGSLRECWAFDCLYRGSAPDDASFWFEEVKKGFELYVYFGPSTAYQAIKLYLMREGMATDKGDKIDPPSGKNTKVHVTVGYDAAAQAAGANPDDVANTGAAAQMAAALPAGQQDKAYVNGSYAYKTARNLKSRHSFPADVHYFIARSFFLASLKRLF